MLYQNKSELLKLLATENLFAEKKFGQNFLINPSILQKILDAAQLSSQDQVLEIGPGIGLLTLELAKTVQALITIEKDSKLYPHLEKILKPYPQTTLIKGDALEYQPTLSSYKIVANIPYYITSPLIYHYLAEANNKPTLMVLLVQREVAEKICAKTGDHTVLSLQTQLFAKAKIIAKVAPGNFHPAPQVDSSILLLETLPAPQITNTGLFLKLIKLAFSQKRKTLLNTLSNFPGQDKSTLEKALNSISISPMVRPQNLSFEEWYKITELFSHV